MILVLFYECLQPDVCIRSYIPYNKFIITDRVKIDQLCYHISASLSSLTVISNRITYIFWYTYQAKPLVHLTFITCCFIL